MNSPQARANILILSVLRHMTGDLSLSESAERAEVPRSVITHLSSEYASYMIPRALRALRWANENAPLD